MAECNKILQIFSQLMQNGEKEMEVESLKFLKYEKHYTKRAKIFTILHVLWKKSAISLETSCHANSVDIRLFSLP